MRDDRADQRGAAPAGEERTGDGVEDQGRGFRRAIDCAPGRERRQVARPRGARRWGTAERRADAARGE